MPPLSPLLETTIENLNSTDHTSNLKNKTEASTAIASSMSPIYSLSRRRSSMSIEDSEDSDSSNASLRTVVRPRRRSRIDRSRFRSISSSSSPKIRPHRSFDSEEDDGYVSSYHRSDKKRARPSSPTRSPIVEEVHSVEDRDKIWADISVGAFRKNIAVLRDVLKETHSKYDALDDEIRSTPDIMAVVKSDAYGHSVPIIARAATEVGIYRFAVATLAEAIAFRKVLPVGTSILTASSNGGTVGDEGRKMIQLLLLASLRTKEQVKLAWDLDIEVLVGSAEQALKLSNWMEEVLIEERKLGRSNSRDGESRRRAVNAMNVHVKVDVGLSRLGMLVGQFDQEWPSIKNLHQKGIAITGICTHFGHAIDENPSSHHIAHARAFEAVRRRALAPLLDPRKGSLPRLTSPIETMLRNLQFHMNNSAATLLSINGENYPAQGGAFSRTGIAMYGVNPGVPKVTPLDENNEPSFAPIDLHPVMSVRARIASVKRVPVGSHVGYGDHHRVPPSRDRDHITVAVVEAGYSDGIPVTLGSSHGNGYFLVNGRRAPILGNVCMNYTMIEVPHDVAEEIGPGAIVTLIGEDGDERVTPAEWETWMDGHVHQYSVLLGLGSQMPRYAVE